ncbi:hypothetical protein ABK040_000080 [Willaertia magna]
MASSQQLKIFTLLAVLLLAILQKLVLSKEEAILAKENEYPYVTSLQLRFHTLSSTHLCTGTFVHPNYILTAAHCLRGVYGNINPSVLKIGNDAVKATKIIVHPNYDSFTMANDIGLIQVQHNAVELPYTSIETSSKIPYDSNLLLTKHQMNYDLLKGSLRVRNPLQCQQEQLELTNPNSQLCVDQWEQTLDQCGINSIDGGSPLMYFKKESKEPVIVALASYAPNVCSSKAVYTNVGAFSSWIDSVIKNKGNNVELIKRSIFNSEEDGGLLNNVVQEEQLLSPPQEVVQNLHQHILDLIRRVHPTTLTATESEEEDSDQNASRLKEISENLHRRIQNIIDNAVKIQEEEEQATRSSAVQQQTDQVEETVTEMDAETRENLKNISESIRRGMQELIDNAQKIEEGATPKQYTVVEEPEEPVQQYSMEEIAKNIQEGIQKIIDNAQKIE